MALPPLADFVEPYGEGWDQIALLFVAFVLTSLIGLERELRQRSAGLRTNAIVGVASALIMLVSKYGFTDVLGPNVTLDPSRVAAQVVSGIGFIGAGLIFVRSEAVRGLTTAATIWLTAAVGMAAGAGLPILACLVTGVHFLVVYGFTPLVGWLEELRGGAEQQVLLHVDYRDRQGVLRRLLARCTHQGFVVNEVGTEVQRDSSDAERGIVTVALRIRGRGGVPDLITDLTEIDGVLRITSQSSDDD